MNILCVLRTTVFSVVLSVALLSGCGSSANAPKTTTAIAIKGSDTMVHIDTAWSEAYMLSHPDVDISVTGGGSGTGISALLGKSTDICASSRDMSAEEKKKAADQGITLQETIVARDGIALVVHPSNPISELDMEQVQKIFTGAITQWEQVNGPAKPIVTLSRETSSGTYVFFQEHVLKKQDFAASVRLMPATATIIQSVSEDETAIGYVGLGYAIEAGAKVKLLSIKKDGASPPVSPSEDTVRTGSYSIARPLYFYTGATNNAPIAAFLAFCTGPDGQKIVKEAGYVPVN